jgi:hypothetical protein
MVSSLRRRRKALSSVILGVWTFALFVGIANACGWDGVTTVPHHPVAAHSVDGMPPGCEQFCNDNLPLVGKLQSLQDGSAGQPLVFAAHYYVGFAPMPAPVLRTALAAHPPPGVPLSLRFVRLTL